MRRLLEIRTAVGAWAPAAVVLLLGAALLLPSTSHAQSYSVAATAYAWIPTTGHTVVSTWDGTVGCPDTTGDDSLTPPLNIGFTFRFGGTAYTQLRINSNGRLQFANTRCSFGTQSEGPPRTYPDAMPDANVNNTIRVYGADLDDSAGGTITYATVGTAPNRTFVVSWNAVRQWNTGNRTSYNLQVQLFENGEFAFHYGVSDDTNTGNTPIGPAQLGWQLTTTDYYAVSGLPANNSALRFTPRRAALSIAKTATVISDPANGTTNPKSIPGSTQRYDVVVQNTGFGPADANSVVVTDPVPANTDLCVAVACGGPFQFVDGSPASGLSLAASGVTYSNQPGGGAPFTYVPVPNASGYDPAVTGIRIAPSGTMAAASASGAPNFTVRFRVRVR